MGTVFYEHVVALCLNAMSMSDVIAVLRMLEVPVQISQPLCFVGFNEISYVAQCTVFIIFGLTKIPFLVLAYIFSKMCS